MSNNSDMLKLMKLMESSTPKFAGEPEQKPGDQVRGTDVARVGGKDHPFKNRLVGEDTTLEDQLSKKYQDFKDIQSKEKEQTDEDEIGEGKWFKTDYGWAGGSKPGGGTYKHPDTIKAEKAARAKAKKEAEARDKAEQTVTEGRFDSPAAGAITNRILRQRTDLLQKFGPEAVMHAIDEVAEWFSDAEEIGTSDVSGWVMQVERILRTRAGEGMGERVAEGSDRVDSLVTTGLKIMRGPTRDDAIAALKTQVGERDFNERRDFYKFYVRQLMDMYGKKDVAEGDGNPDIQPGMKTQYGTVVSVKGNDVVVKASNGDEMVVNIHDIDQAVAETYQVPDTEDRRRFIRFNIWTAMDSDEEVMRHSVEGNPFYSAKKFMRQLDDQGYDFTHVISPEGRITYSPQHDPRHLKNFPEESMSEAKADPTGSWVVYDGSKLKRFKTHSSAKAYAEKNGGKVASSEYYHDKIQKQGVAEAKADPTGSWVVYDGSKLKRFKTHSSAKAYAAKNGGTVASSEYYNDKIAKKDVTEDSTAQKTFKVVYYSKKTDRNVTKTIKANSKSEAWDKLKSKGIDVVSVKEQGVTEGYDDEEGDDQQRDEGFFVAIGNERDGGFVGMINKDGGKWRETAIDGDPPHNWGGSYMSYLTTQDVMQHIKNDYRHSDVGGPFDSEEKAKEYAYTNYGLGDSEDYDMRESEGENSYGYKVGQTVRLSNGKRGQVLDVFDDSIEVMLPGGQTVTVAFQDAEVLGEGGMQSEEPRKAWADKVVKKFPGAKIMMSKMPNGPAQATLNGKVVAVYPEKNDDSSLNELSPATLSSYKEKAGKQASAADKAGDFDKGHKRFKGIVKATNKQFANDAKQVNEFGATGTAVGTAATQKAATAAINQPATTGTPAASAAAPAGGASPAVKPAAAKPAATGTQAADPAEQDALSRIKANAGLKSQYDQLLQKAKTTV